MKALFASVLTLLSSTAFAATITPFPRTEAIPLMDEPATILLIAVLLGFGIRYLRSRQQP